MGAIAKAKSGAGVENSIPGEASIFRSLVWEEIKDEIDPQLYVTLVFYAKLLISAMGDERASQSIGITKEIANYAIDDGKDEIGRSVPPP